MQTAPERFLGLFERRRYCRRERWLKSHLGGDGDGDGDGDDDKDGEDNLDEDDCDGGDVDIGRAKAFTHALGLLEDELLARRKVQEDRDKQRDRRRENEVRTTAPVEGVLATSIATSVIANAWREHAMHRRWGAAFV